MTNSAKLVKSFRQTLRSVERSVSAKDGAIKLMHASSEIVQEICFKFQLLYLRIYTRYMVCFLYVVFVHR